MAKLMKWATNALRQAPSHPVCFPISGFKTVRPSEILDEERFEQFKRGQYYPANIGDLVHSRYQIVGKLGFGSTSTVWLARDLEARQYMTLKIYTRVEDNQEEFNIYKQLDRGSPRHPSYNHIRKALDTLTIPRPGGHHPCLVQKPIHRFTEDLPKAGLMQISLALDYLHTECKLVHTDIKSDNILQDIEDKSILESFTQAELKTPSPRKVVDGLPIYASRRFDLPKIFGRAVLSDFGAAVQGEERRNHDAQPNIRSIYGMLVLCRAQQVWDLLEGKLLFSGNDPDGKGYSTRAHLAEAIGLLGPPPLDMLQRGKRSHEFFTPEGEWKQDIEISTETSLESSEEFLEGRNKKMFLSFMGGMLQWRPEDRKTAKELLQDPWLNDQTG